MDTRQHVQCLIIGFRNDTVRAYPIFNRQVNEHVNTWFDRLNTVISPDLDTLGQIRQFDNNFETLFDSIRQIEGASPEFQRFVDEQKNFMVLQLNAACGNIHIRKKVYTLRAELFIFPDEYPLSCYHI